VGRVLVRSAELPGGEQSVAAGQSLRVDNRARSPEPAVAERAVAEPAIAEPAIAEPAIAEPAIAEPAVTEPPGPSPTVRSPARAARGPNRAAELWEAADSARRAGQSARAAALLERLLRDYPADSQVALAAFTLGVLELDRLEQPTAAAASFQRALELGIGAALREDVYLRWAEALERAGAAARIDAVLAEYLQRYPNGRHRATIERLRAQQREAKPHATPNGVPPRRRETPSPF
jgi:TolA-binding protein